MFGKRKSPETITKIKGRKLTLGKYTDLPDYIYLARVEAKLNSLSLNLEFISKSMDEFHILAHKIEKKTK